MRTGWVCVWRLSIECVSVGSQGGGETTESSSMVNGASREADGVVGVGGQNHLSSDFGEKERRRERRGGRAVGEGGRPPEIFPVGSGDDGLRKRERGEMRGKDGLEVMRAVP